MSGHTPTPWYESSRGYGCAILRNGKRLASVTTPHDAAFIVRAVNAHEAMTSALELAEKDLSRMLGGAADFSVTVGAVRAALKLARGEP